MEVRLTLLNRRQLQLRRLLGIVVLRSARRGLIRLLYVLYPIRLRPATLRILKGRVRMVNGVNGNIRLSFEHVLTRIFPLEGFLHRLVSLLAGEPRNDIIPNNLLCILHGLHDSLKVFYARGPTTGV